MFSSVLPSKADISILPIGRSGVGKSTIGNFILTGEPRAPFETSGGVDSCTQGAQSERNGNLRFTDLPGLPDTDPARTKQCYNTCIDRLKEDLAVALFVFKKERIDTQAYEHAEVLFREINKVDCMKVLVINDHTNYAFGQPESVEAEYSKLAVTIAKYTRIDFDKYVFLTAANARSVLSTLMEEIKEAKVKQEATPELKNFDELERWVEELRKRKNYKEAIMAEMKSKLRRLKRRKMMAEVVFGSSVLASIGAGTAAVFTAGVAIPVLGATGGSAVASRGTAEALKVQIRNLQKKIENADFEEAARELKIATENFLQLRDAIHFKGNKQ